MRRYLTLLICIFAVLFLQLIFSSQINPFRIQPDLLVVAVIFLSFYCRFPESVIIALLAGFLKDSFSAGIFGAAMFSYVVCVIILDIYKHYIYREDLYLKEILVFALTLVSGLISGFFVLSRLSFSWVPAIFLVVLPEALYTTLLAPVLFWAMRKCALKYFS